MKISEKYAKSLENKLVIRLKTIHPDGDGYDGVIMAIKRSFLVLREARDLEFDGTVIIPKRVVRGCRDSSVEDCFSRVIRSNNQIKRLSAPAWLNTCRSIREVVAQLKRDDIWPGVETLFDEGRASAFYLGPIVEVGKRSFSMTCYNAAGRWEKIYELEYKEVFRIEFDSKYCNHFNNYMKTHNKPPQLALHAAGC